MIFGLGEHASNDAALTGHAHALLSAKALELALPGHGTGHGFSGAAIPIVLGFNPIIGSAGSKGKAEDSGIGAMLIIGRAAARSFGAKTTIKALRGFVATFNLKE